MQCRSPSSRRDRRRARRLGDQCDGWEIVAIYGEVFIFKRLISKT